MSVFERFVGLAFKGLRRLRFLPRGNYDESSSKKGKKQLLFESGIRQSTLKVSFKLVFEMSMSEKAETRSILPSMPSNKARISH